MKYLLHFCRLGRLVILAGVSFLCLIPDITLPQNSAAGRSQTIPSEVSMVAVLAAPDKYAGRYVRLRGYLCIEFEGDALYLHEEDYWHALTKNSFALRLSKSQREKFKSLSLKYVVLDGTVSANTLEGEDAWSGAIDSITRLEVWPIDRRVAPGGSITRRNR